MAAASPEKDGVFVLLLLLLCLRAAAAETPGRGNSRGNGDILAALDRQEAQLGRLESLVDSLSCTVSRLESSLSECTRPPRAVTESDLSGSAPASVALTGGGDGDGGGSMPSRPGGVKVTKYKPSWSERFQFAAAARLESEATSATVLPYDDQDGLSKYFAVGDARGRVLVFSSAGDVLIELSAPPSNAPVTAMLSYMSIRRNESLLFVGHGDGSVVAHRLWESAANSDDWLTLALAGSRPFVRGGDRDSPAVLGLEVHQVGRVRYVIVTTVVGRIQVFTENGNLYGTAAASSRPLAFMKQRLLFLTETGAGSLDLRTMAVRETDCEGLNGTRAKNYAFDVSERSKAYGFTEAGHVVHVVLLGDAANIKCRIRAMRKSEIDGPVSVQTIKGYLLAISHEKVFVYNVSSHYYGRAGAPRLLFFATLEEIKLLFLNPRSVSEGPTRPESPLIAGDREKLHILGLGGGYVGIYRSNFPVYKVETNAVLWSSPVLVFLLLLIGIWHFYVKKRDVLGLTQDEVFNPSVVGSASRMGAVASGDRDRDRDRFGEGSMGSELRDIRGGVLRGPSRRYVSPPSRYAGGPAVPFRPGSTDSGFRGAADLKYRAQRMDPPGFPKRREHMSASSEAIGDEHIE